MVLTVLKETRCFSTSALQIVVQIVVYSPVQDSARSWCNTYTAQHVHNVDGLALFDIKIMDKFSIIVSINLNPLDPS